jgi:hypothetical protein
MKIERLFQCKEATMQIQAITKIDSKTIESGHGHRR